MAKRKLTVEIRTVESGQTFQGVYMGKTTRDWMEPKTGEIKPLTTVIFKEIDSENRFGVFQDAGLRVAMENALVKEGDKLEFVKLEKASMSGGRTVNQWDIFALE